VLDSVVEDALQLADVDLALEPQAQLDVREPQFPRLGIGEVRPVSR
jgi:hypothetical protein